MGTQVKNLPPDDSVNSPKHYLCPYPLPVIYHNQKTGEYYIDALAVIKAWGFQANAYIFNLLKYVLRGGSKIGESVLKDWRKGMFYFQEAITEEEKKSPVNIPVNLIVNTPTFGGSNAGYGQGDSNE